MHPEKMRTMALMIMAAIYETARLDTHKPNKMDGRRIRRVRKPTPWERLVARWHAWLEDALENAVCCGVDPATLADDTARFSMGGKQASSVFSIRSMSAYISESELGEYDDDLLEGMSETESESTDDHSSDSLVDMEARYSFSDCDEPEKCASVSYENIPFDDDSTADCPFEEDTENGRTVHRRGFNCVLAELLMVGWTWRDQA